MRSRAFALLLGLSHAVRGQIRSLQDFKSTRFNSYLQSLRDRTFGTSPADSDDDAFDYEYEDLNPYQSFVPNLKGNTSKVIEPETLSKWMKLAADSKAKKMMNDAGINIKPHATFSKADREANMKAHEQLAKSKGMNLRKYLNNMLSRMDTAVGYLGPEQLEELPLPPRCPDLFWTMDRNRKYKSDNSSWFLFIPVIDVGIVSIDLRLLPETGLQYDDEFRSECDGTSGTDGSICKLVCPGGAKVPWQSDWDKDGETGLFKCMCSADANTGDSVCYWRPVERMWKALYYCGSKTSVKGASRARKKRLRLQAWWRHVSAPSRWDESVQKQKEFFALRGASVEKAVEVGPVIEETVVESEDDEIEEPEEPEEVIITPVPVAKRGERPERPSTDAVRGITSVNQFDGIRYTDNFQEPGNTDEFLGEWQNSNIYPALNIDADYLKIQRRMVHLESKKAGEKLSDRERMEDQRLRKMQHLAKLIQFYHEEDGGATPFSRYFQYGCHCFPSRHVSLLGGTGKGLDNLDDACHVGTQCRKCAEVDFGSKCHAYRGYNFEAVQTRAGPIFRCLDDPSRGDASACRHSLCQCDKQMAMDMVSFKDTFNSEISQWSGNFKRENQCLSKCIRDQNGRCHSYDKCCGRYPSRAPYFSTVDNQSCCGNTLFNPKRNQCCAADNVQQTCSK